MPVHFAMRCNNVVLQQLRAYEVPAMVACSKVARQNEEVPAAIGCTPSFGSLRERATAALWSEGRPAKTMRKEYYHARIGSPPIRGDTTTLQQHVWK